MTGHIQHQRLSDPLGRYYTPPSIGDILVRSIRTQKPKYVLDLGAGTGTLSLAASKRWGNAKILSVDIDTYSKEQMAFEGVHNTIQHHVTDALCDDLHSILGVPLGGIDISVCNPPYIRPEWNPKMGKILEESGLSDAFDKIRDTTSDVLFLAQNLRLLKTRGQLGLIVPDGLITGEKYRRVRQYLVRNHDIECCIRLPRGAFKRTDAQAHILLLNKEKTQSKKIVLKDFDGIKLLNTELKIDPDEGISRLDFGFYSRNIKSCSMKSRLKLCNKTSGEIDRGKQSSSEVKTSNEFIFHTSNFPKCSKGIPYFSYKRKPGNKSIDLNSGIVAESGDILIARVHRHLEEKVCIVKSGKFLISDCVYRIRLKTGSPETLIEYLVSDNGKELLKSISSGVSARHISKRLLSESLFTVA